MRTPTDRAAAWAEWRERLAGARVALTMEPRCGLYRAKRGGRWVAVQIDLLQVTGEDGDLLEDECFVAWETGRPVDPWEAWSFCAANPVSARDYERIKAAPAVFDLSRQVVV
jgi:hypothetical protein